MIIAGYTGVDVVLCTSTSLLSVSCTCTVAYTHDTLYTGTPRSEIMRILAGLLLRHLVP